MSSENQYFRGPGSDQTPDMLLGLPCIHHEPGCKLCTFLIDHRVVEEYLKYCHQLAYGFCKIHIYILLGSQKTPEGGRKVKALKFQGIFILGLKMIQGCADLSNLLDLPSKSLTRNVHDTL